ncbi:shikimate kinase, partial [Rhizobium laguerreae]|uniref:shikimate kinase n=1 Tax=Rhizobium laguerreae TaxID=1076926 RepID=UPI001C9080B5
ELQAAQEAYSLVALPPACEEIDDWEALCSDREAALPGAEISQAGTSRSRAVPRKPARVALSPKAGEIRAALGTRPVVLVGMPTSGKSTIGRHLAKELGLDFLDTDKCIIAEHGDVTKIFADRGEGYFRDLEAKELAKCLEKGSLVIATGGGCFNKESNRALILNKAKSIWLDTDLNEIKKRLKNDRSRPLLQVDNREETVDKLYKERSRFYQQADIRVPLVPPLRDKKDARICVEKLYDLLCNGREAALPAAEISHVSGTSGTAISMSPTAQRMHDDHPNRVKGVVETIQAPAAPLSEAERQPPLLVGSNARADLASSSRSRERLSRGR